MFGSECGLDPVSPAAASSLLVAALERVIVAVSVEDPFDFCLLSCASGPALSYARTVVLTL